MLDRLRTQRPEAALSLIEAARGLEPLYAAVLRAQVARQMLAFAEDRPQVERTRALAEQAFALSDGRAGEAGFVTGLALWRLGDADTARPFFEAASVAAYASPALRSAGAFWAARAHLRSRQAALYAPWMNRAADEGRSFHGLLARRIMGRGLGFATVRDILSEADTAAMAALPGGARAFGLLQVGEIGRAEAELRALYPLARQQKPLLRALYLSARDAGLDGLAADLAGPVQALDGLARDDIRYPMPRLSPHGGFRLDQALIYGLARVESNFDPAAISPVGARGLLQIMPRTASYLAGDPRAQDFSDASEVALAEHAQRLHEPALNLKIGQDYLLYLARLPAVGGNLVKLLAVYNAGPNALLRVPGTGSADLVGQDDPLLFIELIPSATTRRFVARVLSASWIYAAKLRVPAPGLDTLASGGWPTLPEARKMETARLH